jgi:hypothetical protein
MNRNLSQNIFEPTNNSIIKTPDNHVALIKNLSQAISLLPSGQYVIFFDLLNNDCKIDAVSIKGELFTLSICDLDRLVSKNFGYMYIGSEGVYDLKHGELLKDSLNNDSDFSINFISNNGRLFLGSRKGDLESIWIREINKDWEKIITKSEIPFVLDFPIFSPDQKKVAFIRMGIPHSNENGLYVADISTCGLSFERCLPKISERLSDCTTDYSAWSPDSLSVSCVSDGLEVFSLSDYSKKIILTKNDTPTGIGRHAWSPDGKWIAFTSAKKQSTGKQGLFDLYLIPAQGGQSKILLQSISTPGVIAWLNKTKPFSIGNKYLILPMGKNQNVFQDTLGKTVVKKLDTNDLIEISDGPITNNLGEWWKIVIGKDEGWILFNEDMFQDYIH